MIIHDINEKPESVGRRAFIAAAKHFNYSTMGLGGNLPRHVTFGIIFHKADISYYGMENGRHVVQACQRKYIKQSMNICSHMEKALGTEVVLYINEESE
jgi:hypothetical protein